MEFVFPLGKGKFHSGEWRETRNQSGGKADPICRDETTRVYAFLVSASVKLPVASCNKVTVKRLLLRGRKMAVKWQELRRSDNFFYQKISREIICNRGLLEMSGRITRDRSKNVKNRSGQCGRLFIRQWECKGIVLDGSLARTAGRENLNNNALKARTILRGKRVKKFPIMAEII